MIAYRSDDVLVWGGDCIELMRSLPDACMDSVVTDPPYALEFMGKGWDKFTPLEFEAWCALWATECFRLLKPGGHLLAFGGTRTFHRLTAGIEDAGFEIRDSIAWLYGSGFPKSLDVSKAIDKAQRRDYVIAAQALGIPLPPRSVDDWTKEGHAPGDKWWAEFRAHLPESDWQRIERAVIGTGTSGPASVAYRRAASSEYDVTAPATPDAQKWAGWGTALKPAFEPIVVARKPLIGTVAANVLAHGTGALNIDASRIGTTDKLGGGHSSSGQQMDLGWKRPWMDDPEAVAANAARSRESVAKSESLGRWPANVILDESQAAALDEQSGTFKGRVGMTQQSSARGIFQPINSTSPTGGQGIEDTGGASRFFYVAKAPAKERPKVEGSNAHPTVKPLALMQWLVRLVTPPGGQVLDPFAGSGTTVEACLREGLRCMAMERETDYLPLILHRIDRHLKERT